MNTNNSIDFSPSLEGRDGEGLLYDVPWLVRDPNEYRMSAQRHEIELRNQAVVDDYFVLRSKGTSAHEARSLVAEKHQLTPRQVYHCFVWYFQEAKRRHSPVPDL